MLVVDRVQKRFGAVFAVRDVSFKVERGGAFALLGPNGAGKTTTMRMILGVYRPDAGAVAWSGSLITRRMNTAFGYLPEERGLYARMSAKEQIVFFARLHGMEDLAASRSAGEWIERLALEPYAARACGELSKGNQQKVQLACAVAHGPQVIVLDEPFSGLDPLNADAFAGILRELRASGTTLLVSSHELTRLHEICDRYCIVGGGVVLDEGRTGPALLQTYLDVMKAG